MIIFKLFCPWVTNGYHVKFFTWKMIFSVIYKKFKNTYKYVNNYYRLTIHFVYIESLRYITKYVKLTYKNLYHLLIIQVSALNIVFIYILLISKQDKHRKVLIFFLGLWVWHAVFQYLAGRWIDSIIRFLVKRFLYPVDLLY